MDEWQFSWTDSKLLLRSLCGEHVVQNDQTEYKSCKHSAYRLIVRDFVRRVSAHSRIRVRRGLELSAIAAAQAERVTLTFKASSAQKQSLLLFCAANTTSRMQNRFRGVKMPLPISI